MLVAKTADAAGTDITIIGLDAESVARLQDGKPMSSQIPDLPHVVILYGTTLRDVVAQLVAIGWVPQSALDEYVIPADDRSLTTWTPDEGTVVGSVDEPAPPPGFTGEPHVAPLPDLPPGYDPDESLDDTPVEAELDDATAAMVALVRAARACTGDSVFPGDATLDEAADNAARVLAERGVSL